MLLREYPGSRRRKKAKLIASLFFTLSFVGTVALSSAEAEREQQLNQPITVVPSATIESKNETNPIPPVEVQPIPEAPKKTELPKSSSNNTRPPASVNDDWSTPSVQPSAGATAPESTTPSKSTPAPSVNESLQPIEINYSLTVNGIVNVINVERRKAGLSEVRVNSLLSQAAQTKSVDMAESHYFAHTSPDGRSDFDFMTAAGYRFSAAGSNLAQGSFGDASQLVSAWMNSAGHRQNILASFGQDIGIGIKDGYYTMFIAKL